MTQAHTTTFHVRHYECDAYGHLNNANYLRYMEHAAIQASAAAGYDDARYAALGSIWLIRETDIEYLLPLRAGDVVEVRTWVADFRRVRSRRRYEFIRVSDGALVARAATEWVYLDAKTLHPVAIPGEMIAAFTPARETAEPRLPFPALPEPPSCPYTQEQRVEWRDIDMAMHVNNANYLSYMEACAVDSLGAFGWSMERMKAEDVAIVARRHRIEYQQPAKLGDILRVTTFLADVRRASALRYFTIVRQGDQALIARAQSRWAFISLATGRGRRIPESILVDFADHIAGKPTGENFA
jgi:acyl-CoA thioester hydrolase